MNERRGGGRTDESGEKAQAVTATRRVSSATRSKVPVLAALYKRHFESSPPTATYLPSSDAAMQVGPNATASEAAFFPSAPMLWMSLAVAR